ncbi:MAG: OmpA family protein [Bacteroidales bacterium]|nr:OmpA family protein [Bacteroidales bacterium]
MKRFLAILTLLLCFGNAFAQLVSGVATDYKSLYARIYAEYAKDTLNVASLVNMATYYSDRHCPDWNLPTAMKYIQEAENIYVYMVQDNGSYRKVSKLMKKKITVAGVRQQKAQIISDAMDYVRSSDPISYEEMDQLAAAFPTNRVILQSIETRRMELALSEARAQRKLEPYYSIIQKYNGTETAQTAQRELLLLADSMCRMADNEAEIDRITRPYKEVPGMSRLVSRRKASAAYPTVVAQNTVRAYKEFLSQYPDCDEYEAVLDKIDSLVANSYKHLVTPQQYADFVKNNRENPLAEDALATLRNMILKQHDAMAARVYLKEFPLDEAYNNIFTTFYSWHTLEGNASPVEQFKKKYPNYPYSTVMNSDITAGRIFDKINFIAPYAESRYNAYVDYARQLTDKRLALVALQRTLQLQIVGKEWPKALARVRAFDKLTLEAVVPEVQEIDNILAAPVDNKRMATVQLQPAFDATTSVLHPSGQMLYYTHRTANGTSIYWAKRDGIHWKAQGAVRFANMENLGTTIYSFYENGYKMILGYGGDIWVAQLYDTVWRVTDNLPYPVNTDYFDGDAFMLPDGSGIILSSDRPNGYNLQPSGTYFHGDTALATDLYFVPVSARGWGNPVNLGPMVNSAYCERYPVMGKDMKTLYFCTDARGLGFGDIYVTKRSDLNSWTSWSTPVNLGKEINTGFNETGLSLSSDGKTLYFCTNGIKDRYGCFSTELAPRKVVAGYVDVQITSPGQENTLKVYDVKAQQILTEQVIAPEDPVSIRLQSGRTYVATLQSKRDLFAPSVVFQPSAKPVTIESWSADDLEGIAMPLPLVRFEPESALLTTLGVKEILNLATFLAANPQCIVEISIHVAGNDDTQCFMLSRNRGLEIKNYLIDNGVDSKQVIISGYGNSQINDNPKMAQVSVSFRM